MSKEELSRIRSNSYSEEIIVFKNMENLISQRSGKI